jgi:hypothetical protein
MAAAHTTVVAVTAPERYRDSPALAARKKAAYEAQPHIQKVRQETREHKEAAEWFTKQAADKAKADAKQEAKWAIRVAAARHRQNAKKAAAKRQAARAAAAAADANYTGMLYDWYSMNA